MGWCLQRPLHPRVNPRESGKNQPKDVARLVCKKKMNTNKSTLSLPFKIFLNEELSDTFWKGRELSHITSVLCPKNFRAVSKKGRFYMKYEHIVKCLLASDRIPTSFNRTLYPEALARERAILCSTALA